MKEYCNPLDIEYKFQHYGSCASREAADPTLVYFKGVYYLFTSMSAGFYFSTDLIKWNWHENRNLDIYRYAPDVRQIGEYLYFCASDKGIPSTIWRSIEPLKDDFEKVSEPFDFWDPNLFCDDDGKVYLYWGCGNTEPIYGIELDRDNMMPIGEKKSLIDQRMDCHGWERGNFPGKEKRNLSFPMNLIMSFLNRKGRPYMEGAYMNKWNGKYYLQYAAPGTQYPVYGDGYYVGDSPLGEFEYKPNNPFSFKPSGFINGAGHGSTIEDEYGNLWHASTMSISVNQTMERRIGLFPAGIDDNGLLFCNQNFADYPMTIPNDKFDPRKLEPKYMLLSYRKNAKASSSKEEHGTELALDESIRTWWCAKGGKSEWYQVDLGKTYLVHSIQVNFAEDKIPKLKKNKKERSNSIATGYRYIDSSSALHTRYIIEGSIDGTNWIVLFDASEMLEDRSHPYHILDNNKEIRYVKVTALELPYNSDFALSGLRIFGLDNGDKPNQVKSGRVNIIDNLTCKIKWEPAKGAVGYNVKYGIEKDKLYSSYLVYGSTNVLITSLNKDQKYWYCIDSFNESGITKGNIELIE